jgi:hypothetical protein
MHEVVGSSPIPPTQSQNENAMTGTSIRRMDPTGREGRRLRTLFAGHPEKTTRERNPERRHAEYGERPSPVNG